MNTKVSINTASTVLALVAALSSAGLSTPEAQKAHDDGLQLANQLKHDEDELEVAKTIRNGLDDAYSVIFNWEGNNLAGSVDALEGWLEGARTVATEVEIQDLLDNGIACAQSVVDNWERGDLAGAVNALEDWRDMAIKELGERKLLSDKPIAVISLSGGNVSDVSTLGNVDVYVLDYDNGEDDESLPEILDKGHASINATGGDNADAVFCYEVVTIDSFHEYD